MQTAFDHKKFLPNSKYSLTITGFPREW